MNMRPLSSNRSNVHESRADRVWRLRHEDQVAIGLLSHVELLLGHGALVKDPGVEEAAGGEEEPGLQVVRAVDAKVLGAPALRLDR